MSTAKPKFTPKRVKIQNGWIWGSSPKENRFTHFGFSQDRKNVKLCTSTMCTVGSSSPSHPSLPVSLSTSLLRQGTSAAAEEELGGVRVMLSTLGMRGRGCAVAFSYQVFVLACFGPVCSYTCQFFCRTLALNSTLPFYFNSLDKWLCSI